MNNPLLNTEVDIFLNNQLFIDLPDKENKARTHNTTRNLESISRSWSTANINTSWKPFRFIADNHAPCG